MTPWTVAHQTPLVHGILQSKILDWVTISFSRESSQTTGMEPRSPALQVDSLQSEPPGKPKDENKLCKILLYITLCLP